MQGTMPRGLNWRKGGFLVGVGNIFFEEDETLAVEKERYRKEEKVEVVIEIASESVR